MDKLATQLRQLKKDEHRIIFTSKNNIKVTVKQTGKFSPWDYAVGLIVNNDEEFYPSHIRLLVDLYIKRESNLEDSKKLFLALEAVYSGKDPTLYFNSMRKLNFPMQLDEAEVNLYLTQLLMIEQDFNYGSDGNKRSKLDPPREYLMRFIRWIAAEDTQIDKIIFAAAGRKYPAPEKYSKPINYA